MPGRSASTDPRRIAGARALALVAGVAACGLALVVGVAACALRDEPIVRDGAGLLAPAQREVIEEHHRWLAVDHGLDYRIETTRDAGDLDAYALRRFEALEVGSRGGAGRGLLLVVDVGSDAVRLEVGRALEADFPDAFVAYLEHRQMVPFFRAGRVGEGILATTELVVERIREADRAGGRPEAQDRNVSSGGGARTGAEIGTGPDASFRDGPAIRAGATPEASVQAWLAAMESRNGRPDLDLYTPATRAFFAGRVMTAGQMDAVVRAHRSCRAEPARVDPAGRAVLRFPVSERACAPFFLEQGPDGLWRLDFATASRVLRFGRGNEWHFAPGATHAYAFAFEDWSLDANGYPRPPRT